ncbi:Uncharacterised protein [Comamonas testosteroni]|uniref:Uncharacterized protein n=1 Tax=Comamonas testosteroni TaxID=285 RepID=A0A8B4S7A9_COMTE|nr:Uncharacterised protein [Comamonas testosteroni]
MLAICNCGAYFRDPYPNPPQWQVKWLFIITDFWQRFIFLNLSLCNQPILFRPNFFQQLTRRLIARILLHQQAAHCELEDGLLQRVHGFGAVDEQVKVLRQPLPVARQFLRALGLGKAIQQGLQ